jgi:hypothetical protein
MMMVIWIPSTTIAPVPVGIVKQVTGSSGHGSCSGSYRDLPPSSESRILYFRFWRAELK